MKSEVIIVVTGYLAKDSELKVTKTGKPMLTFSIPISNGPKGPDQKTDWYRCMTFSETLINNFGVIKRGTPVTVTGTLKASLWKSASGAVNINLDVFANHIEIESKQREDVLL
jgi:single-stranded DNA-binding protein